MKKTGLYLVLLVCFALQVQADSGKQELQPGRRMEALKIAFVTRKLHLSPEEAEKFWPVYNNYIDELLKTRKKEEEDVLQQEENALAIKKRYKVEFKKILNAEARANQALALERDFYNIIRKELHKRGGMKKAKEGEREN